MNDTAPEPALPPTRDSVDRIVSPPITTERAALEYAKVALRSGRWEDLKLDGDTRFNILLASRAVSDLAVDIALTSDSDSENAKAQIDVLRGLAFDIGNRAATTARLSIDKDIQERVGFILKFYENRPATIKAVDMLSQSVVFGSAISDWTEAHTETEEV